MKKRVIPRKKPKKVIPRKKSKKVIARKKSKTDKEILEGLKLKKVTELATFFGYSRGHMQALKSEGLPIEVDGTYNLSRIAQWLLNRKAPSQDLNLEAQKADLEIKQNKARMAKMDADLQEGKLVNYESVIRVLSQYVTSWRSQIEAWPQNLISEMPQEIRAKQLKIAKISVANLLIQLTQATIESVERVDDEDNSAKAS